MAADLGRSAGGEREDAQAGAGTSAGVAKHRRARDTEPRASLYDEVTARIITQLEAGCFPWVQPWSAAAAVPGLPRNAITSRTYSGVNILILWGAVSHRGRL